MWSMLAAVVAGALALFVGAMAAWDAKASRNEARAGDGDAMARREAADGIWMCAGAVAASMTMAVFAVWLILAPAAASEVIGTPSGTEAAALAGLGLAVGAVCVYASARMWWHRQRLVPLIYATFIWSGIFLALAGAAL